MQSISKTRKAINFDLNDNLLKNHYPSKNYKKGWSDIRRFLEDNHFQHRQYSGYVSKDYISMVDVGSVIDDMTIAFEWLKDCVTDFDVTIVGDEYSFIDRIKRYKGIKDM